MDAALFSIRPEPVSYIAQGVKEWEFRTKPPKIETPFKGYIYCTSVKSMSLADYVKVHKATGGRIDEWHGKVIGEFICDEEIEVVTNGFVNPFAINRQVLQKGHLSNSEFLSYTDHYRKNLSALHISQLVIYDKPKGLSEFYIPCNFYEKGDGCGDSDCPLYEEPDYEYGDVWHDCEGKKPLRRPPQSWCRVVEHALNARYTGWSVLNGLKCHFKEMTCNNERMCGMCINNPPNEEKKNGKKPPLPFDGCYCPSCGEPTYSSEACVFCGQRLIREEL